MKVTNLTVGVKFIRFYTCPCIYSRQHSWQSYQIIATRLVSVFICQNCFRIYIYFHMQTNMLTSLFTAVFVFYFTWRAIRERLGDEQLILKKLYLQICDVLPCVYVQVSPSVVGWSEGVGRAAQVRRRRPIQRHPHVRLLLVSQSPLHRLRADGVSEHRLAGHSISELCRVQSK